MKTHLLINKWYVALKGPRDKVLKFSIDISFFVSLYKSVSKSKNIFVENLEKKPQGGSHSTRRATVLLCITVGAKDGGVEQNAPRRKLSRFLKMGGGYF